MTKCCGAFLRPCDNTTERILCAACYAFVDKVLDARMTRPAVRQVYRKHHGVKAQRIAALEARQGAS